MNNLSGELGSEFSGKFKNPKLFRILFENCVFRLVPRILKADWELLSFSRITAVAASPNMKCASLSLKFKCPEQISGLTTRTLSARPD